VTLPTSAVTNDKKFHLFASLDLIARAGNCIVEACGGGKAARNSPQGGAQQTV